jgi:hypothetical protein
MFHSPFLFTAVGCELNIRSLLTYLYERSSAGKAATPIAGRRDGPPAKARPRVWKVGTLVVKERRRSRVHEEVASSPSPGSCAPQGGRKTQGAIASEGLRPPSPAHRSAARVFPGSSSCPCGAPEDWGKMSQSALFQSSAGVSPAFSRHWAEGPAFLQGRRQSPAFRRFLRTCRRDAGAPSKKRSCGNSGVGRNRPPPVRSYTAGLIVLRRLLIVTAPAPSRARWASGAKWCSGPWGGLASGWPSSPGHSTSPVATRAGICQ